MKNLILIGLLSITYSLIITFIIIDKVKEIEKLKYKLFRYKRRIDYLQYKQKYYEDILKDIKILKPKVTMVYYKDVLQGSDKE